MRSIVIYLLLILSGCCGYDFQGIEEKYGFKYGTPYIDGEEKLVISSVTSGGVFEKSGRIQVASATGGGQWPGAVRGFRLNDQVNPKCPLTTA